MQIHDHCFVVVTLLKALSCSGFINYKLIGPDIFTLIIDIFFLLLAIGGFELYLYLYFQTTRGSNQS
jgi:hypothetical protein